MPLVSIITVVYNNVQTIERTIQSVINQTYKNIEYIIIDGGSSDGTLAIIEKYKPQIAKLVSEKDKGIYDAMNKGVALAKGILIGTLNSDDWLEPNAIELITNEYLKTPTDLISGSIQLWNNGKKDKIFLPDLNGLKKNMTIYHPSTYISKKAYQKYGIYDLKYKQASDYELILKMYMNGASINCINNIITNMALGGLSDRNWVRGLKEVRNIKTTYVGRLTANIDFILMYVKHLSIRILYNLGLEKVYLFYKKIKLKLFKDSVILN